MNSSGAALAIDSESSGELDFLRATQNMELLPDAAHELIEVIGLQACINLVARYGGQDLMVPGTVGGTAGGEARGWGRLVDVMGEDAAAKMVGRFAGTVVYIPMCTAALREERDRTILRLRSEGASVERLGRQFKITRRHVFRIMKNRARFK